MYAVFQSGGKQHRVAEGHTVRLEKIEVATGETIEFDQVLLIADGENVQVGTPLVAGGKVVATVVSHGRGEKVTIQKFNRRKHHEKKMGHRQWFTEVKITAINA
ncbi:MULTISPECIES: 50S ribosomal protein L21 [Shewanella]|jgi:large subunit ribosomal protein L21|uniref:Large ribosomal subunit protein bL21 n=5 Tax=Bacteria TaxID=2 RepID=A0A1S2B0Z2_9GAMM|nr:MULTISPECIES: 50S ribosomal protein L21 [Shewanella]AXQ13365.1 50S ribosomal protein L21 [Shewanella algae]AYV14897.1 50S ribosomal protein L21 [Shewanella algae]EKT4489729.1 50S ribosomal protein L21 [Shewanella algae]MBC8798064.1 50S ribosomal protein L21 [Shewanella algae]MBO2549078.1 50S ribosomal protein L21 [Shewanella algae]